MRKAEDEEAAGNGDQNLARDLTQVSSNNAMAASKEAARMALELAIRVMGTHPARVEAAERERDAAEREREEALKTLRDVLTDEAKDDALVIAAHRGNGPAVAQLLVAGANPDAVGSEALEGSDELGGDVLVGGTPLKCAIYQEHRGVVEQLLTAGANLEGGDRHGIRPLMAAAANGDTNFVERLLEANVAVDARDGAGQSALHWATMSFGYPNADTQDCDRRAVRIIAMLLQAGADRTLVDNEGETALQRAENVAEERGPGYAAVVAFLRGFER